MELLNAVSQSPEQTAEIARTFAKTLTGNEFIAMYGDLGAGKTVFVRGLANELCPDCDVCSPSYSIMNEYDGKFRVCHFDMYRITGEDDLYSVGFYDYDNCVMVVEWSEKIQNELPAQRYEIRIEKIDENQRRIRIEKTQ